jgi:hypothetical protein
MAIAISAVHIWPHSAATDSHLRQRRSEPAATWPCTSGSDCVQSAASFGSLAAEGANGFGQIPRAGEADRAASSAAPGSSDGASLCRIGGHHSARGNTSDWPSSSAELGVAVYRSHAASGITAAGSRAPRSAPPGASRGVPSTRGSATAWRKQTRSARITQSITSPPA